MSVAPSKEQRPVCAHRVNGQGGVSQNEVASPLTKHWIAVVVALAVLLGERVALEGQVGVWLR